MDRVNEREMRRLPVHVFRRARGTRKGDIGRKMGKITLNGEKESEDFGYSPPCVPVARHSGGGISGVEGVKERMQGPRFFFANEGEKREMSGE
jgi:hypothetical protein